MKTVETYKFRKGQKLHLDEIYSIQGLAGGDWWTADDPGLSKRSRFGEDAGETVTITRNITIRIQVS